MRKVNVDLVVSGVRRAAALVETTGILMTTNADGDQEGSDDVTLNEDKVLMVALTLYGEPGASFIATITKGAGSATRKGRLVTSVALRAYPIPLSEFK